MDRSKVSHVPIPTELMHPMHELSRVLVANRGLFADQCNDIRDFVLSNKLNKTPTLYQHNAVVDHLKKTGGYDKLRAAIKQALIKEPKLGQKLLTTHPKPPPAKELYGRIHQGAKVLDIGSGDGRRLLQFGGQIDFTTQDPKVKETKTQFRHIEALYTKPVVSIVTSFNALTNNEDQSAFVDSDGLHVIPNLQTLCADGFSKHDGTSYVTQVGDVVYKDYDCPIPASKLNRHYSGVNTFKARKVNITVDGDFTKPNLKYSFKSCGQRMTNHPNSLEGATVKLDGELLQVMVKDGNVALVRRDGSLKTGKSDGPNMILLVEDHEGEFYLLRVGRFRDFIPFHTYEQLGYFLKRIDLKINGKELSLPPLYTGAEEGEGVVLRHNNEDFMLRYYHSFDFKNDEVDAKIYLIEKLTSKKVVLKGEPKGEIGEFLLKPNGLDGYLLEFHKTRFKYQLDSDADVKRKLKFPTLKINTEMEPPPDFSSIDMLEEELLDDDE